MATECGGEGDPIKDEQGEKDGGGWFSLNEEEDDDVVDAVDGAGLKWLLREEDRSPLSREVGEEGQGDDEGDNKGRGDSGNE